MPDTQEGEIVWVDAVVNYVRDHNPGEIANFELMFYNRSALKSQLIDAMFYVMYVAFEAGRNFQKLNPDTPLGLIDDGDHYRYREG
jgi:hypothetical protein